MSDIYCYEGGFGFVIHVAGRRRARRPIPDFPYHGAAFLGGKLSTGPDGKFAGIVYPNIVARLAALAFFRCAVWWHRLHMWDLGRIPMVTIDLPHAGETFEEATCGDAATRLLELRKLGYNVPQYAIDQLQAEANEGK
jgi:hypothetical protein